MTNLAGFEYEIPHFFLPPAKNSPDWQPESMPGLCRSWVSRPSSWTSRFRTWWGAATWSSPSGWKAWCWPTSSSAGASECAVSTWEAPRLQTSLLRGLLPGAAATLAVLTGPLLPTARAGGQHPWPWWCISLDCSVITFYLLILIYIFIIYYY